MDRVKCEEIQIYFSKREKRVLDVLDGYAVGNWEALKEELRSLYTSLAGKKTYQPRDIQHYIVKKRNISKLLHFDTYRWRFKVITKGLEAWRALSDYDRDDYFWSGIRPKSLREVLEMELRSREYWMDLTLPPPMARVIEVAVKFLNRAMYQPRDVSSQSKWVRGKKRRDSLTSECESDNEEMDSSALSTEEELSSEDSDDGVEERKRKAHVEKKLEERKDKGAKVYK